MPESYISVRELSGSDATDRLREALEEFNEASARQMAQVVRLTRVLVVLTALLFIGLVAQLVLAFSGS